MDSTCYLIGVPDPTASLTVMEVFISICGRAADDEAAYPHGSLVVVARFPLMSSSSIRLLRVHRSAALSAFVYGAQHHKESRSVSGGIIIFGCQSAVKEESQHHHQHHEHHLHHHYGGEALDLLPAVHCMQGDYDGDKYFVCGDIRITSHLRSCNGFTSSSSSSSSPSSWRCGESDTSNGQSSLSQHSHYSHHPVRFTFTVPTSPLSKESLHYGDDDDDDDEASATGSDVTVRNLSMFEEYVLSKKVMSICLGFSANMWLMSADQKGSHSAEAKRWAALHCMIMEGRKHTWCNVPEFRGLVHHRLSTCRSRDIIALIAQTRTADCLPHYAVAEDGASWSCSSSVYRSTSVIGRLYDFYISRRDAVPASARRGSIWISVW